MVRTEVFTALHEAFRFYGGKIPASRDDARDARHSLAEFVLKAPSATRLSYRDVALTAWADAIYNHRGRAGRHENPGCGVRNAWIRLPKLKNPVSVGEEIAVRSSSLKLPILELAKDVASHGHAPNWLEIDRDNYKGRIPSLPKRDEVNMPVNEQLIVELYSK